MAQLSVRELQQRLAALAATYGDSFPVTALGAEARSEGRLETVAILGFNGCGKSSIADMLVGGSLPMEEMEEGEIAGTDGPTMSRMQLELAGDQQVEAALAEGKFRLVRNPEPHGHPDHLAEAAAAFKGYYKNIRSGFGEPSYLLPLGSSTGSTTQFDVRISQNEVPALLIMPRTLAKLQDMVEDCLENMIQAVNEAIEEGKNEEDALCDDDFIQNAAMFSLLTGIDVADECDRVEAVQHVLDGWKAKSKSEGALLRASLVAMKDALVPLLLEGAQQNISSDIWFLRHNICDPVGALLQAAGMQLPQLPDDLDGDEGRTLQGLLIEYVHATVPAPGLGSVMLIDKPGLNDERSLVKYNIAATLSEANHIILVTNKGLLEDSGLVKYLVRVSAWATTQLAADEPRGTLTVVRYYEKVAPNVQLKKLFQGELDSEANKSFKNSRFALLKTLRDGPALPTLPRSDRTTRIERFLDNNCSYMSLYPATFMSVALDLASDVSSELQRKGVQLPGGSHPQAIVLELCEKTRMQELLKRLGKLSGFRDLQTIKRLKAVVGSVRGAITSWDPAEDAVGAGAAAQAAAPTVAELQENLATWEERVQQLTILTSRPYTANTYVVAITNGQFPSGSWTAVQSTLSDALDQIRETAVAQCQDWLANASLARVAVRKLKEDGIRLGRLRAILKRDLFRKLRERDGRPGLVEHIEAELSQNVRNVFRQQKRALYEAHTAAAASVARMLEHVVGRCPDIASLRAEDPEWWSRFWEQQLVEHIAAELKTAARDMFIASDADDSVDDNAVMSRLSRLLRLKMGPKLSALEMDMPKPARPECWNKVEAAIMEALAEVSEELPAQLEALFKYDYLEHRIRAPFLQEVRNRNHLLAVVEMRPEQLDGQPKQQRLVARRAAQPCLWRRIFRFLCAACGAARHKRDEVAAAVAAAAAAANGPAQQQAAAQQQAEKLRELQDLLQELQEVSIDLDMLADRCSGPNQVELQQRRGNGLAQRMLQHARQSQVELFMDARRNGIQISEVYVLGDILKFDSFAALRGLMAVPPAAPDSLDSLQALFDRLAYRSLYCAPFVTAFASSSALEAAFISVCRHAMTEDSQRRVIDMVAFQMECDLERLQQDLAPVPQYREAGTAAYLQGLVAGTWWTSLLELQWLACVLRVNFIVFSTLPCVGSRSGRKMAFYIQHRRGMRIGGPMHTIKAYPLAVCLRAHEGAVRPWFLALEHDPELSEAAIDGSLRAPCINSALSLQGTPEEVSQLLEIMTRRSAISCAAGGSAAKRPRMHMSRP